MASTHLYRYYLWDFKLSRPILLNSISRLGLRLPEDSNECTSLYCARRGGQIRCQLRLGPRGRDLLHDQHSILWAIIHGILSWLCVVYFALFNRAIEFASCCRFTTPAVSLFASIYFGLGGLVPALCSFGPRQQGKTTRPLNWVSDTRRGSEDHRLACRGVAAGPLPSCPELSG